MINSISTLEDLLFTFSTLKLYEKTCIIIVGPTAVGKTSLAIDLALQLQTEIISADSRQCYKELTIGVAKPTTQQLQSVKHYFINSHSITDEVNAAIFEKYALDAAEVIFKDHPYAIMVGGTGLYIRTFCEGIDHIPRIPPEIREAINTGYSKNGVEWLKQQVRLKDPEFFLTGEIQNPQRLMRALEVISATGTSIRSYQKKIATVRPFNILKIGLEMPRAVLYENINKRVDLMIEQGLVEEVRSLAAYKSHNALQTVGYKEIFSFLEGEISLPKAVDEIKKNSRHYAKRQLTWFKKDFDIKWYSTYNIEEIQTLFR